MVSTKIKVVDGREVHARRKRINPSNLRGKHDARHQLIINSRYSSKVLKSQQIFSISENRNKLEKLIAASNGKASYNKEYGRGYSTGTGTLVTVPTHFNYQIQIKM